MESLLLKGYPGIIHGFPTKRDPPVPAGVLTVRQVHGNEILAVGKGESPPRPGQAKCDGIATDVPGLPVGVYTADCVPLLLYAPRVHAVAAVHAGRRGTAKDVAAEALKVLFSRFGADPADIIAAIGPSIGPCCYRVGGEVAGQFDPRFLKKTADGFFLDLKFANLAALLHAGLRRENVEVLPPCTCCSPALFFSYRRDRGIIGEHLNFIGLRP